MAGSIRNEVLKRVGEGGVSRRPRLVSGGNCMFCTSCGRSFRDREGIHGYVCMRHIGHVGKAFACCEDYELDVVALARVQDDVSTDDSLFRDHFNSSNCELEELEELRKSEVSDLKALRWKLSQLPFDGPDYRKVSRLLDRQLARIGFLDMEIIMLKPLPELDHLQEQSSDCQLGLFEGVA